MGRDGLLTSVKLRRGEAQRRAWARVKSPSFAAESVKLMRLCT
jgi:hypothetical protein